MDIQIGKNKVGRPEAISSRGIEALVAIWRYQSLGTRAIHRLVAKDTNLYGLSKELIKLENKGYLAGEKFHHPGYRWSLTPSGFSVIEPVLTERLGALSQKIEKAAMDSSENLRHRWHQKNQAVLVFTETLRALSAKHSAQIIMARELFGTQTKIKNSWLPKRMTHTPDAFVHWNSKQVFAVEYILSGQTASKLIRQLKGYSKKNIARVFFILEKHWNDWDSTGSLAYALREIGGRGFPEAHIIPVNKLSFGEHMRLGNSLGEETTTLIELVLREKSWPEDKSRLSSLLEDLNAKAKVWGRAYQRNP